jgi:hypothetical protein
MLEAPFALLAEIVLPLFSAAAEITLLVLVASVRPWAYAFSPRFRQATDLEFVGRSKIAKLGHLLWGTFFLAASIAVVAAIIWFFSSSQEPVTKPRTQTAIDFAHKAGKALKSHEKSASTP